jgi:hypothetical protein
MPCCLASLKRAIDEVAREDGTKLNQFIVSAVAEKLAAPFGSKVGSQASDSARGRLPSAGSSCLSLDRDSKRAALGPFGRTSKSETSNRLFVFDAPGFGEGVCADVVDGTKG